MSVKTSDFNLLAVEVEAILLEATLSEAEAYGELVLIVHLNINSIKLRIINIPQVNVCNSPLCVDYRALKESSLLAEDLIAIKESEGKAARCTLRESNVNIKYLSVMEHVECPYKCIVNIYVAYLFNPYLAVDTAIYKVVNHVAEGRYLFSLSRVKLYNEHIAL